jgi:hypothetical protein
MADIDGVVEIGVEFEHPSLQQRRYAPTAEIVRVIIGRLLFLLLGVSNGSLISKAAFLI